MLGVVLLSEFNDPVHALGNDSFRDQFLSPPPHTAAQQPSSSSGISSKSSSVLNSPRGDSSAGEGKRGPAAANRSPASDSLGFCCSVDTEGTGGMPVDRRLLIQQRLLPLIALCRTSATDSAEQRVQCIQSGATLHLRLTALPHDCLLVLVHEESVLGPVSSQSLLFALLRCVDFHYGPQLQLLPLGSPLSRQLQLHCEHRMLDLMARAAEGGDSETKGEEGNEAKGQHGRQTSSQAAVDNPFCLNAAFGSTQRMLRTTALGAHFRELAKQIAHRLGRRCRCLFLLLGQPIASASSHGAESVLTALRTDQLHSVLQFGQQPQGPLGQQRNRQLRAQAEHSWLHSKTLGRAQPHSLLLVSLDQRLDMLCMAPTEHSQLLSTLNETLDTLERVGDFEEGHFRTEEMAKCERQLKKTLKMLGDTFSPTAMEGSRQKGGRNGQQREYDEYSLVDNVPRTKQLIQHLWTRFSHSLGEFRRRRQCSAASASSSVQTFLSSACRTSLRLLPDCACATQQQIQSPSFPLAASRLPTLNWSTVGSRSSTLSYSRHNPLPSSPLDSASELPAGGQSTAQFGALRAQLRRVLRSLMDELLTRAAEHTRRHSLPLVQSAVRNAMDNSLASGLDRLCQHLARRCPSRADESPLRPAAFGLDMLAYRLCRLGGAPLHFQFAKDDCGELLATLTDAFPIPESQNEGVGEELTFARTVDGRLIIQFCSAASSTPHRHKLGALLAAAPLMNSNSADNQFQCIAIFSHHVNIALGMKQSQRLVDLLSVEMDLCQQNFH